jgi:hypothetical protein
LNGRRPTGGAGRIALGVGQGQPTDEQADPASLVEHRWRHPVEPQLGTAEEPYRADVVDDNPVQVDEATAWRALNVRAFDVRGEAVRIRIAAELALDCPGRGRRVARVRPSNSSLLPRRWTPT